MRHTPIPWTVSEVDTDDSRGPLKTYELQDAQGRTIMDVSNSEVACIVDEHDEDGRHAWDEQGRLDIEFAGRAINHHDQLREALRLLVSVGTMPPGPGRAAILEMRLDEARSMLAKTEPKP